MPSKAATAELLTTASFAVAAIGLASNATPTMNKLMVKPTPASNAPPNTSRTEVSGGSVPMRRRSAKIVPPKIPKGFPTIKAIAMPIATDLACGSAGIKSSTTPPLKKVKIGTTKNRANGEMRRSARAAAFYGNDESGRENPTTAPATAPSRPVMISPAQSTQPKARKGTREAFRVRLSRNKPDKPTATIQSGQS